MWLHTHMQMQSHARSKLVVEQTFGYIVVSVNIARKMYKLHQRPLPEHEQKIDAWSVVRHMKIIVEFDEHRCNPMSNTSQRSQPNSHHSHMIPWFMHECPIRTCASKFPSTVYSFTQGMLGNCSRALPASASFEDCSMTLLTCSHGQGFSICWGPHATIHVCAGFGGST